MEDTDDDSYEEVDYPDEQEDGAMSEGTFGMSEGDIIGDLTDEECLSDGDCPIELCRDAQELSLILSRQLPHLCSRSSSSTMSLPLPLPSQTFPSLPTSMPITPTTQ